MVQFILLGHLTPVWPPVSTQDFHRCGRCTAMDHAGTRGQILHSLSRRFLFCGAPRAGWSCHLAGPWPYGSLWEFRWHLIKWKVPAPHCVSWVLNWTPPPSQPVCLQINWPAHRQLVADWGDRKVCQKRDLSFPNWGVAACVSCGPIWSLFLVTHD